jgi:hypothetical protein
VAIKTKIRNVEGGDTESHPLKYESVFKTYEHCRREDNVGNIIQGKMLMYVDSWSFPFLGDRCLHKE